MKKLSSFVLAVILFACTFLFVTPSANASAVVPEQSCDNPEYFGELYPNPDNRNTFWECTPDGFELVPCPTGLEFDVDANRCDYAQNPVTESLEPGISQNSVTESLEPGIAVEKSTGFPKGDFRIINQNTGQALYVKLGDTKSISYYRLGNETTYYVSAKPTINRRQASGGAEEAWYFDAGKDRWGTPHLTIVSVVVGRDTNLGNHCLSREGYDTVYMYGCTTDNITRWQSADGYIGIIDENLYLTIANGSLTLQPKNEKLPGQRWRFESAK